MTILLTGGAGFIGSATAERLLDRGEIVVIIDNFNDYYPVSLKRDRIARLDQFSERLSVIEADFSDATAVQAALADIPFDRIVHLGAQAGVRYSLDNPMAYAASNLTGHLVILELARHRGVRHMVYASSSSVYGNNAKVPFSVDDPVEHPISLYAATKRADELISDTYAHLYRIPLTGLRFFTVYGPWGRPDMMAWKCTDAVLEGRPIQVFNNGEMSRDFTFIDDIVAGVIAVLDNPPSDDGTVKRGGSVAPHALYNIGNNQPENLMRFIGLIEDACGRKAQIEFQPMQPGDVPRTYADIDAIASDLGYAPTTPIDVGIPAFVEWFKGYRGL
ncbi:NAD-dependent epimerase/dehydratase family protein [Qipengyuania sp.]|uniref:NAD-dependent epimerase/dehydratase family protein n=1 Tax=Qipengyuania sp. TaxID=2004515 RepID=UPI0035C7B017